MDSIPHIIILPDFTWDAMLKHASISNFLPTLAWFYSSNVAVWVNVQTSMRRPTSTCSRTIHRNHRRIWRTMTSTTCIVEQLISTIAVYQFSLGRGCRQFWRYDHYRFTAELRSREGVTISPWFWSTVLFNGRETTRQARRETQCMIKCNVIHYRNLQQCTHGLHYYKDPSYMQFVQSPCLPSVSSSIQILEF